ncbi:MAG: DUF5702 domain-containing protein [Oscillospiraceae bacterium]|nr:DUF5702 domain-containing protein [Oscillospiraceae bacterium]
MKKLFGNSNNRGAVTVFVTLLLIPAILVSGTAVDAARIYTTRSAVQNANQLAANASLASYSALLKDLYALFGFMSDDPELASMIDEYIRLTVYGKDRDKGTFRAFAGSDEYTTNLTFTGNLRRTEVLKEQILEYMKFRGPAIILQRIFGQLNSSGVDRIVEDSDILDVKMGIDDSLDDVLSKYRELYYAIMQADSCKERQGQAYVSVSGDPFDRITPELEAIRDDFVTLDGMHVDFMGTFDLDTRNNLREEYRDTLDDIRRRAENIEQYLEGTKHSAEGFKQYFTTVVTIATELDQQKEALRVRVDDLRRRLEAGDCSQEIYDAFMRSPPGDPGREPLIDQYGALLDNEVLPMALRYRAEGVRYIDEIVMPALDDPEFIRYRDNKKPVTDSNSLTIEQLKTLTANPDFSIEIPTNRAGFFAGLSELPHEDPDYVDFLNLEHFLPDPFYRFGNDYFGPEQVQFWLDLQAMVAGGGTQYVDLFGGGVTSGSDDSEDEQRREISRLEGYGDGYDTDEPGDGAQYIDDPSWTRTSDSVNLLSLAKNVIRLFGNPTRVFRDSAEFALVLTYDMSMFSNYTTTKPNRGTEYSITGIPMNSRVNYYYQSEWEYLLIGNKNARDNLSAIKSLIYDIRFLVNFVAVWSITQINNIVNMIRALPIPFGIPFILGELARLGFVLAETSLDVSRLRGGYKVAIYKTNETWLCKPSTFGRLPGRFDDRGAGFTYEDYLTVFFVAKAMVTSNPSSAANVLTSRTADLIEWNVVNYQYGVNANESEMATALQQDGRFRMSNAATTVEVETTVEMRMLFLSMPFAQRGVNGVIPPATMPITVTDVRGY